MTDQEEMRNEMLEFLRKRRVEQETLRSESNESRVGYLALTVTSHSHLQPSTSQRVVTPNVTVQRELSSYERWSRRYEQYAAVHPWRVRLGFLSLFVLFLPLFIKAEFALVKSV